MGMSIFLDSQIPINPDFESKAYRYYRTEIKPVNFTDSVKASRIINYWVDEVTNGKVSEIVETGRSPNVSLLKLFNVMILSLYKSHFLYTL